MLRYNAAVNWPHSACWRSPACPLDSGSFWEPWRRPRQWPPARSCAHLLKDLVSAQLLSTDQLASFETAVRYQIFHALGLILVGVLAERAGGGLLQAAAWAFLAGIVLFSGGIYGWLATDFKPLVHVVPVGGLTWIVGWLLLAAAALRR